MPSRLLANSYVSSGRGKGNGHYRPMNRWACRLRDGDAIRRVVIDFLATVRGEMATSMLVNQLWPYQKNRSDRAMREKIYTFLLDQAAWSMSDWCYQGAYRRRIDGSFSRPWLWCGLL